MGGKARALPSRLVILGDPVAQSLSPVFQNAALRAAGIDLTYESLRVPSGDLARAAADLARAGGAGNVTVPHKVAFVELCSDVTGVAARVGAVNTFWAAGGKLVGDNTDVGGFDFAARELLERSPENLDVAVIGAGGSAAAVLGAIEGWPGSRVRLFSRRSEQAVRLARRFDAFARAETSLNAALGNATLVVNATPAGMEDDELPFDLAALTPGAAVLDLVYRAGGTRLSRAATSAGFAVADGTSMLIEQGALAFERWFGFPPDRTVMRSALA